MTAAEAKKKTIGVLMGGLSSEREISLRTGAAVLAALQAKGYRAQAIDADRQLPARLQEAGVEVAFIALHGRYGEDGTVQGLLEILGIPYTGSGVLASSLAMDKAMTKRLLVQHGVPTPEFTLFEKGEDLGAFVGRISRYPQVVKPSREGSTIGITIAKDAEELTRGIEEALKYDGQVLVEDCISGPEVTVGVLDGQALPIIQVVPKGGFYDYHAKYTAGQTEYILPAPLEQSLYSQLQQAAVEAFKALGCCGAARVDFMIDGSDFYCLEVNTIPGMTATSLLPKAAGEAGIPFEDLAERILLGAGTGK